MKGRSIYALLVMCLILACSAGYAAQTVNGTVISTMGDSVTVKPDGAAQSVVVKTAPGATVMRGQVGLDPRKATLCDFSPGDRVVAVVGQNGQATSVKAYYAVAKGTLASRTNGKLFFKDGKFVKLAPGVRVVTSDGKVGGVEDLSAGASLICRLNPSTDEAWMVVATKPAPAKLAATAKSPQPAKAEPAKVAMAPKSSKPETKVKGFSEIATAPVYPGSKQTGSSPMATVTVVPQNSAATGTPAVQPVIESVVYAAPATLRARDWMRIDMAGTPGGRAICEVKGLIPRTVMKEMAPGEYRASVMVPSGKFVNDEPVLGHLTIQGVDAPVVQASKLITVTDPSLEPVKLPEPVVVQAPEPAPAPEPEAPAPAPEPAPVVVQPAPEPPAPEPPKVKAPVVLTAPVMGTKILRTLVVTGTAEPGSNVIVTVTYTNGVGGLLNLSGQVSSQLIATTPDGQFRMGPIPLEGPLATRGLMFTVKACYPDAEQAASVVSVFGDRS